MLASGAVTGTAYPAIHLPRLGRDGEAPGACTFARQHDLLVRQWRSRATAGVIRTLPLSMAA